MTTQVVNADNVDTMDINRYANELSKEVNNAQSVSSYKIEWRPIPSLISMVEVHELLRMAFHTFSFNFIF